MQDGLKRKETSIKCHSNLARKRPVCASTLSQAWQEISKEEQTQLSINHIWGKIKGKDKELRFETNGLKLIITAYLL